MMFCVRETPPKAECVFFQMAGCITAQRDSDVPLTFAAGRERARRERATEGRVKEDGGRGRKEGGMAQSDTCRTKQ